MSNSFDVVIPAYNTEDTVSEAIASGFAAGASRVIVVDDGSHDQTSAVARTAGAEVFSKENAGASIARRFGLAQATADYVILLDADDALLPKGVGASLSTLQKDASLVAAGGAAIGRGAQSGQMPIVPAPGRLSLASLLEQGYSPVPPACILWRRVAVTTAANDGDPAPLRPRYAEDYELLVRGGLIGGLWFHAEPAALYSLDGGKSTVDPSRSIRASAEIRAYYAEHRRLRINAWGERHVSARVALRQSKNETGPERLALIARAARLDPALIGRVITQRLARAK